MDDDYSSSVCGYEFTLYGVGSIYEDLTTQGLPQKVIRFDNIFLYISGGWKQGQVLGRLICKKACETCMRMSAPATANPANEEFVGGRLRTELKHQKRSLLKYAFFVSLVYCVL